MDSQSFKTLSEQVHRRWLARQLRMHSNEGTGIDLGNERFAIELKSCLDRQKWAVHAYQFPTFREQNPGKELYWAFLQYSMSRTVDDITTEKIGSLVRTRHVWFMPWEWISCRPVTTPKTGPYRYVYGSSLRGRTGTRIPQTFMPWNRSTEFIVPTGSTLEAYLMTPF